MLRLMQACPLTKEHLINTIGSVHHGCSLVDALPCLQGDEVACLSSASMYNGTDRGPCPRSGMNRDHGGSAGPLAHLALRRRAAPFPERAYVTNHVEIGRARLHDSVRLQRT